MIIIEDGWLRGALRVDYSADHGYGPFKLFLGVIGHVNVDENGTTDAFFYSNPASVCPNFQVYKNGTIHQYLRLNQQPWCQSAGNYNYAAIETAGMPDEPYTDAQVNALGLICAAYAQEMGMPLTIADAPGQHGLGTHSMGGAAWGGHSCPGTLRASQRAAVLAVAHTLITHTPPPPTPEPNPDDDTDEDQDMVYLIDNLDGNGWYWLVEGRIVPLAHEDELDGGKAAGVKILKWHSVTIDAVRALPVHAAT